MSLLSRRRALMMCKRENKNLFNINADLYGKEFIPSNAIPYDKQYRLKYGYAPSGWHPSANKLTTNINNNSITWVSAVAWYGLGYIIPVEPNTKYVCSYDVISAKTPAFSVAQYKNGKFFNYKERSNGVPFTTSADVNAIILCWRSSSENIEFAISNVQLELGGEI